jgi:predicted CxxxxCH...CXXCH cytochrome family protein
VPLSSAAASYDLPASGGAAPPGHRDGVVDVVFGPLASNAGAKPTWNKATASCSTTYCHGSTLPGGSNNTPVWTKVDGSQVSCGTCHGIPPPQPMHPDITVVPGYDASDVQKTCNACHPGTVQTDGSLDIPGGQHIDGVIQLGAYACARCHGDVTRLPLALSPAPPFPAHDPSTSGSGTAATLRAVGAHLAHLTGTTLTDTPVACSECHAVPTSMLGHPNPAYSSPTYNPGGGGASIVVDMTWGPLATAGGTVPSWNVASLSCSATYCHGGSLVGGTTTSPVWTQGPSQVGSCTSCHGDPPATPAHTQAPNGGTDCGSCHTGYTQSAVDKAQHIDGYVQIGGKSCVACHGSASKVNPFTGQPSPVALQPAPGGLGTNPADRTVGAHDAHLFGKTLRATPIACGECHISETSTDHPSGRDPLTFDRMSWGPLATDDGSHPLWNAPMPPSVGCPPGGCTCATTYCHGSTLTGGVATAPSWTRVDGSQVRCNSCHGDPPPLPHEQRSDCSTCHTGYTSTTVNLALHVDGKVDAVGGSCTSCHGDPSRLPATIAPAPPAIAGTGSSPWAASDPGAHLKHLTGTLLRKTPIACSECHVVPTTTPGPPGSGDTHGDGFATVVFGTLAKSDGASPRWNATAAPLGCAATYCHGGTLSGGTETAPLWNETGGTASACGACHGNPPATTSQGGKHPDVAATQNCNGCHTGYSGVRGGPITINTTLHLNGVIDSTNGSGSCASCHGDPARTPSGLASAPPAAALGVNGATPPWAAGEPGAHQKHLTGTSLRASAIACAECHAVPTTWDAGGTHIDGSADVRFGSLSRTGGAAPTWNANTLGCAASYCHGGTMQGGSNTAPTWTGGAAQVACGTCHGLPPPLPHPPIGSGTNCNTCHAGYGGFAGGPIAMNTALHLNGRVDSTGGTCTTCHGDAARVLVAGADPLAPSSPPVAAGDAGSPWAGSEPGAHLAHLDPAPGSAIAAPIACSECHVVPSSLSPSGTHENGAADVAFGARATAGGAAPTWNATTLGCAASYCHGGTMQGGSNTAPTWNGTSAQVACGTCHGLPPTTVAGGSRLHPASSGADCGDCHTGYTSTTVNPLQHVNGVVDSTGGTCTTCHGDATRILVAGADPRTASAPPVNAGDAGSPWAGGDPGAHLAHLDRGALAAPVACSECHVVPSSTSPSGAHENGAADVAFGTLARAGGAAPTWNATTLGCAASYCHGGTMAGGTNTAPTWNGAPSQVACGTCHGLPPATVAGGARVHPASSGADCGICHTGYTGTTVNAELHVNGTVDASGGTCTTCHGDSTRVLVAGADPQTASAPPLNAGGSTAPWAAGDPGAHLKHLNPASGSALAAPVDCAECHVVPSTMAPSGTHQDGIASVVFGALARTNGAAPTWSAGTLGCAASYCHGGTMAGGTATTPVWNVVDGSQATCLSCHGMPPATVAKGARAHPASSGTDCGNCHTGYTGTTVNVALHVNGTVDATGGTCTSCHGDSTRVLATGADAQAASAPPQVANVGSYPFGPGAHQAHLNKGTGAIGKLVACSECHAVPASSAPTGTHENGRTDVTFGSLAKTVLTLSNGTAGTPIAPVYLPGSATVSPSCSATYCHGNFILNAKSKGANATVSWDTPGPLACTACHLATSNGIAPNDSCHPPSFDHDGGNRCSDCHKNVNSTGTSITNATLHVNGAINGKCTDCHSGASLGSSKNRICQ